MDEQKNELCVLGQTHTTLNVKQYFQDFVTSKRIENEDHRKAIWCIFESLMPEDPTDLILCSRIVTITHWLNLNNDLMLRYQSQLLWDKNALKRHNECARLDVLYNKQLMRAIDTRDKYKSKNPKTWVIK